MARPGCSWGPSDPDALAAAFRKLLENDDLSERLGEQGRRRVVARYDWKQVAERVEVAYEAAVNTCSFAAATA
jgi:glycosyltransferase involved in cell wall biosynthesis